MILLAFLIGMLLGFYGDSINRKLAVLIEEREDKRAAKQMGVVRVVGHKATKNQPIDLSSDAGPVRRPTPAELDIQREDDRARQLRENHS